MLVALSGMGKLGLHLGFNELLNKSTISLTIFNSINIQYEGLRIGE
jgi:hypothetical protein